MFRSTIVIIILWCSTIISAQDINIRSLSWMPNSHLFWTDEKDGIYTNDVEHLEKKNMALSREKIYAAGLKTEVEDIVWSQDLKSVLIYTNSTKVWRENTKGDYWYFDLSSGKGHQIGASLASSSLQFAKFSPDGKTIAYVSQHNLYKEDIATKKISQLTKDGTEHVINGTFDWAYEEELSARDGFSWSPKGDQIAYYRVDASQVKSHKMINNTDSLYPFVIEVEYPKAGEKPSAVKIGVINLSNNKTTWLKIPGDADNNYLPRMSWAGDEEIMAMQLNRYQNKANFFLCNTTNGNANKVYGEEVANGWITAFDTWGYDDPWWNWVDNKKSFLRNHEKDGWLRISKISKDGSKVETITTGNYDASFLAYDASTNNVYFEASPLDATQRYLYSVNLNTKDTIRLTPMQFDGTNKYKFSTDGKYALHTNSSIKHKANFRLINLPSHKKIYPNTPDEMVDAKLGYDLEKFKVKTIDGVDIDGIMAKPLDFDPNKKYPVLFFTYGEPASAVANDVPYFNGLITPLIPKGYIGIAMDNRGAPVYKGTAYRMAVYKKLGIVNARDQAMAAKEVLKWPFIDTSRVAVHGWSGGGAMTLNLLFQYPEIYKVGVAVSAISDQHFYDNIYTERFMGLPQEEEAAYEASSPVTYAKNLQGHLLYMHGTGDDNVHYKNAEVLINELVKQGKLFELLIYPNRTHGIREGEGTRAHLSKTFIDFVERWCPSGAR